MPINFTQLSMTELRTRPGEILDRTAVDGEAFIIERNGQRKACLVPLSYFLPDIAPSRIADELDRLAREGEVSCPMINEEREFVFQFVETLRDKTEVSVSIVLPHGYPNNCPRVYAMPIEAASPHVWEDGALCLYGMMTGWNPGKHSVFSTLELARSWLVSYDAWRTDGSWPESKE